MYPGRRPVFLCLKMEGMAMSNGKLVGERNENGSNDSFLSLLPFFILQKGNLIRY